MSMLEETIRDHSPVPTVKMRVASLHSQFLKLLFSARLGVALLCLLGAACLMGMLIMQQNVDGFDRYFADLSPVQRLIYGELGFFDIYHSWYFNALLALLSLNIILASVDRFPKTWVYILKPSVTVPLRWLREQRPSAELKMNGDTTAIASQIIDAIKSAGWSKAVISERKDITYIFAQKAAWNRLGAYCVHIGLLTIFTGGFLTSQLSSTGQLPLSPGKTTNLIIERVAELGQSRQITKQLPFEIFCNDLQQTLIKKGGSLSAQNTLDWVTHFTITDETGTHDAVARMNQPFDYRGYRFFQSSFKPVGRARTITLAARSSLGGESEALMIPRDGTGTLADGTVIRFTDFRGNFRMADEDTGENTTDYKNPAAVLQVTSGNSQTETAYAVSPQMRDAPFAGRPVGGYIFQLIDFEKVADQHILSVQRDPGAGVVYAGFVVLFISLAGVFLFSHQRVWAAIEQRGDEVHVVLAGHTNRNLTAFNERFRKLTAELRSKQI